MHRRFRAAAANARAVAAGARDRIAATVVVAVAVAAAVSLVGAPSGGVRSAQALGPKDRRLTSLRAALTVEAPPGWTLSQHTGYRETVVLMLHPDGSRISVTAAATEAATAAALFEQNRRGLDAQGLQVVRAGPGPRDSLLAEMNAPARGEVVRQVYLVRTLSPPRRQAVVLTLVCRTSVAAAHATALDFAASRLVFEAPPEPPTPARIGSAGANGSAGPTGGGGAPGTGSDTGNGGASATGDGSAGTGGKPGATKAAGDSARQLRPRELDGSPAAQKPAKR